VLEVGFKDASGIQRSWADIDLDDLDDAEITFGFEVDRLGKRRPTKTDGSARTVPIPRALRKAQQRARTKTAPHVSCPPSDRSRWESHPGAARLGAVDALVQAHSRLTGAPRRRERG
jgi:hypothetical protein